MHRDIRRTEGLGLRDGATFTRASPEKVIRHLEQREIARLCLPADRLCLGLGGGGLRLVAGGAGRYPVRRSFFEKLGKWFGQAPYRRLSPDTIVSVLNDVLLNITSGPVTVTIEEGEATSITSHSYVPINDLEVIASCEPLGIESITRDDFMLRLHCRTGFDAAPVPGDMCGFGYEVVNSETGFEALGLATFVLRYACSNGMVVRERKDEARKIHSRTTREELKGFIERKVALAGTRRQEMVRLLGESAIRQVTSDERTRVRRAMRRLLGTEQLRGAADELNASRSVWELANTMTSAARGLHGRDRYLLEVAAGDLVHASMRVGDGVDLGRPPAPDQPRP